MKIWMQLILLRIIFISLRLITFIVPATTGKCFTSQTRNFAALINLYLIKLIIQILGGDRLILVDFVLDFGI